MTRKTCRSEPKLNLAYNTNFCSSHSLAGEPPRWYPRAAGPSRRDGSATGYPAGDVWLRTHVQADSSSRLHPPHHMQCRRSPKGQRPRKVHTPPRSSNTPSR
jgi:hypothetical protein